jgi:hypothetical protein
VSGDGLKAIPLEILKKGLQNLAGADFLGEFFKNILRKNGKLVGKTKF